MSFIKKIGLVCFIVFCCAGCRSAGEKPVESAAAPRIINIINFIRQTDYRVENADSLLYETVCEQVKLVNKYDLPATFLLQYDALINPLYQDLLKSKLNDHSEIGAWWELTQPQIEAAGIKWRGEHSWVSHANIAFSTGYTKEERERLVDVYMAKFKEIFGTYPKSIGSWFIDAHTLGYMYDKYKIVASCNCKDQVGTDGYTLWGGYWNQAYYPSRVNAYMPAQTEEGQIPVPIFRMLGSDPIYQYDDGLGQERQGVISLEPVYEKVGMDRRWVDYFLESIVDQPCLAFNYAQAGQENSFTWSNMSKGLEMQIPILDSLRKENKIRVETLGESGAWFKECFKVTPATAVTTLTDVRGEGNKTVWFNSRYYRANLLWEKGTFRFRDIHLFDESYKSAYLEKPGDGNQFLFYTLPVVDGFMWSEGLDRAGLRIVRLDKDGDKEELALDHPVVTEIGKDTLVVSAEDSKGHAFKITFYETRFEVVALSKEADFSWALELKAAAGKELPFTVIEDKAVNASFDGFNYVITCEKGHIRKPESGSDYVFRIFPSDQEIVIDCTNARK
ncbi:hypothetical protein [Parabacteroides sp. 20_3]|uniref:hypothetical protein n=1 Tax=Parabacteroides sp. 20_3 TaxID=469591 RepID=UPI0018F25780|nr:hypothetical protein [Parabacteroides sp. 20_3]